MRLSKNFKLSELDCKCGCRTPATIKKNLKALAVQLEIIRRELGNRPMSIVSGYRCPAYNIKRGGAEKSLHLQGKAADFKVKGVDTNIVYWALEGMMRRNALAKGGLHGYERSNFVHYDYRGRMSRW